MNIKINKQKLLDELYAPYKKCLECPLGNLGRTNVVFGAGNPDATLMFIGEAPGKDEDEQGHPFVGRSGKLLNRALEAAHIKREDVFITNIVKCRPPKNRTPTPQESTTCKNILLHNQIKIIQPSVICTLGSAAIQGLLGQYDLKISAARESSYTLHSATIIPTYHPAYIMRRPREMNNFVRDIQKAQGLCAQKNQNI